MTNREYELIDYIRTQRSVKWYKVLNAFGPATEGQYNNAVLEKALADKLIQSVDLTQTGYLRTIRITNAGLLALLAAEERTQREASVHYRNVPQKQSHEQFAETDNASLRNPQIDPDQDHVCRKQKISQFLTNVCQGIAKVIGFLGSLVGIVEFIAKLLA